MVPSSVICYFIHSNVQCYAVKFISKHKPSKSSDIFFTEVRSTNALQPTMLGRNQRSYQIDIHKCWGTGRRKLSSFFHLFCCFEQRFLRGHSKTIGFFPGALRAPPFVSMGIAKCIPKIFGALRAPFSIYGYSIFSISARSYVFLR